MHVSFRCDDETYEKIMQLSEKWNNEYNKIRGYDRYSQSDIVRLCINLVYEMEMKLPERNSVQ